MIDRPMPSRFLDRDLHAKVKKKAKALFERWPSAYGSAWMTKEYVRQGGRLAGDPEQGVGRWMREEWVQVLPYLDHDGRRVPCGDGPPNGTKKRSPRSRKGRVVGPACRPSRRISKKTPITIQEAIKKHGEQKVRSLATEKGRDMDGRVDWKGGRFVSSKLESDTASPVGTSHTHGFMGLTYYMPDGFPGATHGGTCPDDSPPPPRFDSLFDYAMRDGSYTQAVVVIRNGTVWERYRNITASELDTIQSSVVQPFGRTFANVGQKYSSLRTRSSPVTSWSVAKSVVTFVACVAAEEGYIPSLDVEASLYLHEWRDDSRSDITIRNLMDMRSGLHPVCCDPASLQCSPCTEADKYDFGQSLNYASEGTRRVCLSASRSSLPANSSFFLSAALDETTGWNPHLDRADEAYYLPGGSFLYHNCDTTALGIAIERAMGAPLPELANRTLFSPLGITEWEWWEDMAGEPLLWTGLDMRAVDFAAFGRAVLEGGIPQKEGDPLLHAGAFASMVSGLDTSHYRSSLRSFCAGEEDGNQTCPPDELVLRMEGFDGQYVTIDRLTSTVVARFGLYAPLLADGGERRVDLTNWTQLDLDAVSYQATLPEGVFAGVEERVKPSVLAERGRDEL